VLAACGGDDEAAGGDTIAITKGTVRIKPDPRGELAYAPSEVAVVAGKTKIVFENPQTEVHDLNIENAKGKSVGRTFLLIEDEDSIVANLKPGKYTFYCSVTGHRKGGMEGTLTVE
jgi:plastocyanin